MTTEPDIAAILEQLRAEVRAARAAASAQKPELSSVERDLRRAAEQIEITRVVSAHWPLEGRSLYERGWALVHKVVRRYLRWYINPIVEQQNAFNDAAARAIRMLIEANAELHAQLDDLRRQLEPTPPASPAAAPGPPGPAQVPPTSDLQRLIERAGRAEPPAALPDLALRPLPARAADRAVVRAHWDLPGDTPLLQAKGLAKKSIRQYLRWMINPIVEQQSAANAAVAEALPHLLAADAELRAQIAAARSRLASG